MDSGQIVQTASPSTLRDKPTNSFAATSCRLLFSRVISGEPPLRPADGAFPPAAL